MKLVVALALLSNAAAFMAPVTPRAPATPLKAITTEVRSNVRNDFCLQCPAVSRDAVGAFLAARRKQIAATLTVTPRRP